MYKRPKEFYFSEERRPTDVLRIDLPNDEKSLTFAAFLKRKVAADQHLEYDSGRSQMKTRRCIPPGRNHAELRHQLVEAGEEGEGKGRGHRFYFGDELKRSAPVYIRTSLNWRLSFLFLF